MRIFLFFALLLAREFNAESVDSSRLPKSVRPEHYKLKILTHLDGSDQFSFYGEATILLNVLEDSENVTLHNRNLTLDTSKVTLTCVDDEEDSNRAIPVARTEVIQKHEFFVVHTGETLKANKKYKLFIPFSTKLNEGLYGYYRSSYLDKTTNERHWLSTTQFEPIHARLAFPCFDEPEMKAKFQIILGHHKKYNAISNMPLKSSEPMESPADWVLDEFEESVPMSTYLVAYSVNDLAVLESPITDEMKIQFKTWARPDAISQAKYASEIGPKVLKYYEDQFDIEFPLPKIDQIAVPDFSPGAMENWGMVTYRETALLYAPNVSSTSNKHRVASVISHELAHQWFGNLVTMDWWTDIWLNEGFATYVASLGVEYLHPEWSSLEEEAVDRVTSIFKFDALKSSHPVSVPIKDANDIPQIFDDISYSKGACVIRMMHLFVGSETFQRGVTNYLKKFSYKNAQQDDLWESLTEVGHRLKALPAGFTVKEVMDSWTLQTGYPIITVIRDYTTNSAAITQNRYLLDSTASRNDEEQCWWVPLSRTTESQADFNSTRPSMWLECNGTEVIPVTVEDIAKPDEWIIFNLQLSGLYKVKYDDKNWDMLIDTLQSSNFAKIHPVNRAQLIDDALDLAWTGDQDYNIAIRLIAYLRQETEYIPWKAALSNLNEVNRMLKMTPQYEHFKKYMRQILYPIYQTLGGLNHTSIASQRLDSEKHRVLIAGWSCRFEVGDCIDRSREYYKKWQQTENPDKENPVPLNLRSVIYCAAIRHGSDAEWNFLWKRYVNSNVAAEKNTILSSLACSREIWILQRYLEWAVDDTSGIRKQDAHSVFSNIARNEIGFALARDFFVANIDKFYRIVLPESSKLSRFLRPLADLMNSRTDYHAMKRLVDTHNQYFLRSPGPVNRALERIEVNSQWKERNYNEFAKHLQKYLN